VITNEDAELSLRVAQRGLDVYFDRDALVHYRYRSDARTLFRQGLLYGRYRVLVARRARDAGVRDVPRLAGWRSWLLLVGWLPRLRTVEGRASWCWVAGVRLGVLRGCLLYRTAYL
jgi:GT2 family glycosyltransferase